MKGTHPVIWGGDGHKWVVGEVTPSRWVESAAEGAVLWGGVERSVLVGTAIAAVEEVDRDVLGEHVPSWCVAHCGCLERGRM